MYQYQGSQFQDLLDMFSSNKDGKDQQAAINISETQHSEECAIHDYSGTTQKSNFQTLIKKLIGDENFQKFNIQQQLDLNCQVQLQERYIVTIPISFFASLYGVSLDISFQKKKIIMTSYYIKPDQSPLYASDKNIINQISFYALKQNDKLHYGSLSIDPWTGLFQYKTLIYMSFYEQIQFSDSFLEVLRFNINNHKEIMKGQASSILYQMNKITYKQYKIFNDPKILESKNKIVDSLKLIMREVKLNEDMTEEQKNQYLDLPKPKNLPILSEIFIKENNTQQILKQTAIFQTGGQSEIRKVQLAFSTNDKNQNQFRSLALKTNKATTIGNKVGKELEILKKLQNFTEKGVGEAYIVTSYYDKKYDDCYFMEFYSNGSLEQYANSKSLILSLRTKLWILAGIINGLDFLHFNQIAHLDIKMENILIQKQLIPKISDFGEALSFKELGQDKKKFSYSLPYTAPEIFNDRQVSEAADIFSYGILMCNFIFEQFPFDYNPNELKNLEERYKQSSYSIKRNLIKETKHGPKKLMKILLKLIVLCLQKDPKLRPKPKWILTILWKMIHFIDSF